MQNQGKKVQQSSASFPIMNTLMLFFEITNMNFLEGLGVGVEGTAALPRVHKALSHSPCCNHELLAPFSFLRLDTFQPWHRSFLQEVLVSLGIS